MPFLANAMPFPIDLTLPNPELKALLPLLADPSWPTIAATLRMAFLAGFGWMLLRLLWRIHRENSAATSDAKARMPGFFTFLAGVVLLLIAGWQAKWQLLGRQNPDFVGFMQRYDRREFNPAHRVRAGRLLDRNGRVLAVSQVTPGGIQRVYPFGPVFSHVLGYNHPIYGLTGLEAAARPALLGGSLRTREDVEALGAELLDRESYAEGPPLTTTLDLGLQRAAFDLLGDRRGAVVLMDVETGDLRVLLSRPAFDPNRLNARLFQGQNAEAPLFHRAVSGQYPPGSVFKVLIAAAALERGFQGSYDTPPEGFTTAPANPRIRDSDYYSAQEDGRHWAGHGRIGLGKALAKSSNVFFAQLGIWVGWTDLHAAAARLGMLQDIALWERDESTLRLPSARLPNIRPDQSYRIAQFSIGQGELLVSPLHMAMLCAAVANGGEAVAPRLDAKTPVRPLGQLCNPEAAAQLRGMMRRVVTEGTGRGANLKELTVAGKTGTAQTGTGSPSHGWFAGFAPVDKPRWAFCVLVEHGGYGSRSAVPIARDLLRQGVAEGWLVP